MSLTNRIANPVVAPLLRTRVGASMLGGHLVLVEYIGRHTRTPHRLVTQYEQTDGTVTINVGNARDKTWWRNFSTPYPVRLHLSGTTVTGWGHVERAESGPVQVVVHLTDPRSMTAAVHDRYGPPEVLELRQVPVPLPKYDEVRVRVHSTTVNRTDCGFLAASPFIVRPFSGAFRPRKRVLGTEFAGVVDAVGSKVTSFSPGDHVFGVNANAFGTHAEFVCVREDAPIETMPANTTFDEAAAVCDGAILAMTYLRAAALHAGQRILVYGASGSIGTAAVQLAKHMGGHVDAACDTRALEAVRSLGADETIDRTTTDPFTSDDMYDIVFDAVGKLSFARCRRSLRPHGIFMSTDLGPLQQNPVLALVTAATRRRRVLFPLPQYTKADVRYLKDLMEAGAYKPVIDRRYPFDQIVDATRYVETEHKIGNVVLTLAA